MRMLRLVSLALVLAAWSATPAVAQTALQDSVTGGGVSPEPFCNGPIEIDAHSGPGGEDPSGHVRCGTLFDGPVTCLNVQGNVALLTVFDDLFGTVSVRITDAGSTGDAMEAFPTPGGCPGPLLQYVPIAFSGDIVVVDAPTAPASKDQCRNGGWQTYEVFENQGDCVSFVATKGGNAPAKGP
jgi:hypothetical protein